MRRSAQRGGCSATSSWPPLPPGSGASPARSAAHWAPQQKVQHQAVTMQKPPLIPGKGKVCHGPHLQAETVHPCADDRARSEHQQLCVTEKLSASPLRRLWGVCPERRGEDAVGAAAGSAGASRAPGQLPQGAPPHHLFPSMRPLTVQGERHLSVVYHTPVASATTCTVLPYACGPHSYGIGFWCSQCNSAACLGRRGRVRAGAGERRR